MAGYSKRSLIEGIEQCRKNIQTFQEAIKRENETIDEYRFYIREIDKQEAIERDIANAHPS